MNYLDKYQTLGILETDVFDYFMSTLKKSIITWDYFTDFERVKNNIKPIEVELAILNTLVGKDGLEQEFLNIIREYPKVRSVLPILIALRIKNTNDLSIISSVGTSEIQNMSMIFDPSIPLTTEIEGKLTTFFENSRLKDFLASRHLKNIIDYCYGVEVGLDSNARKNRGGIIMEALVERILTNQFGNKNAFFFAKQATASLIRDKFGISVDFGRSEKGKERRIDFVIIKKDSARVCAIETNAYMGGGSKLKSTAGEYVGLHELISQQKNVTFIWITDGPGWQSTKAPLKEAFQKIDFIFNLEMVENGFLQSIIV